MRRFTSIAAGVAFLASAAFAAPTVVLQPSRTSGVAPLAVHFDATGTTEAGLDAFSQLSYRWNFGDSAAGTWQVSGLPKNSASGPISAHVFETPGTYTVQLQVSSPNGGAGTRTVSITVADPNTVYSGVNTICVSVAGSFAGCPSGAMQVTSNNFSTALGYATTGRRVLLRRGETFDSGNASLNRPGPVTVGAFPATGAPPLIRATTSGTVMKLSGRTASFDDWRFMDLAFEGPSVSGSELVDAIGQITRLLMLRVSAKYFHTPLLIGHRPVSANQQSMHEEFFLVDSELSQMRGGVGGVGGYIACNRSVFLGNRFDDATQVEHNLRLPHIAWGVISNNYFANAPAQKHLLKLHALGENGAFYFPERRSHDFVISDNTFVGTASAWDVAIGPQNSTEDERVYRAIIERNLFRLGPAGAVSLVVWGSDITVRNNVFDVSAASGGEGVLITRRGIEPAPTNDEVNNNTCYSATGTVECVRISGGGTGHASLNNLAVGAVGSSASGVGTSNLAITASPWAAVTPSQLGDYRTDPARGSALIDAGSTVAAAGLDPLGVVQPTDGDRSGVAQWDIGAFEVGTPTGGGGGGGPPLNPPAAPVLLAP